MVSANVRLVRLLGQGGMGSVWVADHLTLRTQVAQVADGMSELSGSALRLRWVRYCVALLVTALVCSAPELFYLRVPRDDDQDVRNDHPKWKEAYRQPLDFGLCPALHWGCRYLTLDHRTLVGHVWTPQAIADLREEQRGDLKKSLAAIEGVFLRGRTLRYAKFDESRLYAVDLIGANVEHATFPAAQLQDVRWSNANLWGST